MGIHEWLSISKYKTIPCPDGTIRNVLKNPNEFMQTYAKQWKSDLETAVSTSQDVKVKNFLSNKIVNISGDLDQYNTQLRLSMQAIYYAYWSNPCPEKSYINFWNALNDINFAAEQLRLISDVLRTAASWPELYHDIKGLAQDESQDYANDVIKKISDKSPIEFENDMMSDLSLYIKSMTFVLDNLKKKSHSMK